MEKRLKLRQVAIHHHSTSTMYDKHAHSVARKLGFHMHRFVKDTHFYKDVSSILGSIMLKLYEPPQINDCSNARISLFQDFLLFVSPPFARSTFVFDLSAKITGTAEREPNVSEMNSKY